MYDISSLKVNDLTLILLTWRKWWAPNKASKYHMGFNSGFKGLNIKNSNIRRTCGTNADRRNAYRVLETWRKNCHQTRPRHRWEDIKTDLQERGWVWAWWTTLIWLRTETDGKLLWTQNEPSGPIRCGEFLVIRVSTRALLYGVRYPCEPKFRSLSPSPWSEAGHSSTVAALRDNAAASVCTPEPPNYGRLLLSLPLQMLYKH